MSHLGRSSVLLCLISALGSILPAQDSGSGKPIRIGVIDVQRLVIESKTGKEVWDRLEDLRQQKTAEREALHKEHDQAFARIEREAMPIIVWVGQEQGFTLLFNKYESGLIYATKQVDITDQILQLYDASVTGDG